jgi:hypothetical protein
VLGVIAVLVVLGGSAPRAFLCAGALRYYWGLLCLLCFVVFSRFFIRYLVFLFWFLSAFFSVCCFVFAVPAVLFCFFFAFLLFL